MQFILPKGHQEPCGPVSSPFTIEFTKAISQLSNTNSKYFFSFLLSSIFSLFLLFFSFFYCYLLAIIKSWSLILNLCLFSFFLFILFGIIFSFCFYGNALLYLKVQSCKLYNNKYMIWFNSGNKHWHFHIHSCLSLKLLSCKVLFTIETVKK